MSGMLEPFVVEFVPEAARIELDRLLSAYSLAEKGRRDGTPENTALIEDDPVAVLRSEYEAFRAASVIPITVRPLSRGELRTVKAAHPPRSAEQADEETVRGDRLAGLNLGAAEDDIVFAALVDPVFESRAAFDEWANGIPQGMFNVISVRVWNASTGAAVDPKSLAASPAPRSDEN